MRRRLVPRVLGEGVEDDVDAFRHLGAGRRDAHPHLVLRDVSLGGG
ncbi:hypothetical protein [Nocardioides pyridinolyticus]